MTWPMLETGHTQPDITKEIQFLDPLATSIAHRMTYKNENLNFRADNKI